MTDLKAVETQIREAKRGYVLAVLDILGREDMTQADLARACKLTHQHLAQSLHQQPNSTLRTLCRIAGGLGYRVRIILEPAKTKVKETEK